MTWYERRGPLNFQRIGMVWLLVVGETVQRFFSVILEIPPLVK